MLSAFTSRFGYGRPAARQQDDDDDDAPSQFPLPGSIQRASTTPSVTISTNDDNEDDDDDDDERPNLPELDSNGLIGSHAIKVAPLRKQPAAASDDDDDVPKKKSKPRQRKVFIEPGYSQLDWAKLKKSGTVDLRGLGPSGAMVGFKRIGPRELAKHNKRDDCWQAYGGKVYNVTHFLKYHPGGVAEIMRAAGRDGTALFMKTHPWVNTEMMLDACLIGFLVSEDPPSSSDDNDSD